MIDLETTGLFPQKHDRVIEIAVVSLSDSGELEGEWSTLINPQRDVGPTRVHGIQTRDVLEAPTFGEIVPQLIRSVAGRTLVAHNARFDTQFLDYEFDRAKIPTRPPTPSLCTMEWSTHFLRGSSRKLKDCCHAAGVEHAAEHTALGDARAVAGLLVHYLGRCGVPVPWDEVNRFTRGHWWPPVEVPVGGCARVLARTSGPKKPDAWLDRISSNLPRNPDPRIEAYLDVLERAMLDRYLSAYEEQTLIEVAADLGLQRDQLAALHATYLDSLAIAAWEDGAVTEEETDELVAVAHMLGLPSRLVPIALERAEHATTCDDANDFRLQVGDQVVFTGELSMSRDEWISLAQQAGLRHGGVNKGTRLVVAADPDSQSGKAAKARSYGIPVITEAAFARMVSDLH